jgi:hypothetical protein
MKTTSKLHKASTKTQASDAARTAPDCHTPIQRPGGTLGIIIDRLATKSGATADELVAATGWQRHAVRGAPGRLRLRGFTMKLDANADRKACRRDTAAKPATQLRARG